MFFLNYYYYCCSSPQKIDPFRPKELQERIKQTGKNKKGKCHSCLLKLFESRPTLSQNFSFVSIYK